VSPGAAPLQGEFVSTKQFALQPSPLLMLPSSQPSLASRTLLPQVENNAVTDSAALMVTSQVDAEPEQAPPHPRKRWFAVAMAVSVTTVPLANEAFCVLHDGPQLIAIGAELTVPVPVLAGSLLNESCRSVVVSVSVSAAESLSG
jgi:hypothetical protein